MAKRRKPDFVLPMHGEREVLEIYGWKLPERSPDVKEPWEKELEKHDGPRETASEALRLLAAEDTRQDKLHELLETIREQIRLHVAPEHRPEGLFQNIQDAVYTMRGRTRLMDDAAITGPLTRSP